MGPFLALRNPIELRHAVTQPPELDLPSMVMNGSPTRTFRAKYEEPAGRSRPAEGDENLSLKS
jgi:hypothetical protein